MKALVFKELKSVFCSSYGAFFSLAFLLIIGSLLWFFLGMYNLVDTGYADMARFFDLAPVLLVVLIPALTMRSFSEERKGRTLDVLMTRPVSMFQIYISKFLAVFIFMLVTLLPTFIYVYSLYCLSNPIGNIDLSSIMASYTSLVLLIVVFISIGVFGSATSPNQAVAFIISVILCVFTFYGFNLLSGLFLTGKAQATVSSLGLFFHYELMHRGIIQLKGLLTISNYIILFSTLSLVVLNKIRSPLLIKTIVVLFILNIVFFFIPNYRADFTSDKRYTLSDCTINLLKGFKSEETIDINIYLAGDLNYGFQRLQDATVDLLGDYDRYINSNLNIRFINTYEDENSVSETYESMADKRMPGVVLNEMDREGKASKKIIYPYAQVSNGKDTLVVSLLKNMPGYTAEENINASIENLEFEFTDAIRLLGQKEFKSVAFIEGHNEVPRTYVFDAEEILSKYYFVNRGEISNNINVLNDFEAVIIAGPLSKFSEVEKYILDQYIMSGGKVLWLLDGVYYSHQNLVNQGYSASIKNDVNLDDMLFSYGVRINPDLIQDTQCVSSYLVSGDNVQSAATVPSYFQPLLIPSPDFSVTKNIRDVKAGFASSIDIVNSSSEVEKHILLTTSASTHLLKVPEAIDFDITKIQGQQDYFNQQFIPVAVSLEGIFTSIFQNRIPPDSIRAGDHITKNKSNRTKMIVVSSSDVITNEVQGTGQNSQVLPMGYDRVSEQQFGNRDFIINAMNWLTDEDGLMELRTKQQKLYILNKKKAYESRNMYAVINIGFPIFFILLIMGMVFLYRRRKYEKNKILL